MLQARGIQHISHDRRETGGREAERHVERDKDRERERERGRETKRVVQNVE